MRVGIIGTGAMGGPMAQRLLSRGHRVHVHDVNPNRIDQMQRAGATVQPNPGAVARHVDVVVLVVVTADECSDVVSGPDGLEAELGSGHTVLLCSTIAPESARSLAATIHKAGARTIDAPISGGPKRARSGEMSMMIAAPSPTIAAVQPLLDDLATQQFIVSEEIGDASTAKLLNNLAAGVNLVAAMQAMAAGTKLGLDPQVLASIMAASSGQSWAANDRIPRALDDDFTPRAALSVLTKDLTLAVELLEARGESAGLTAAALANFHAASAAGWQDHDDAALYRWLLGHDSSDHPWE